MHDPIADCCGKGTCEAGEDCTTCSADCASGSAAACGNGICETADGEDCLNCPSDCNGVTSGRPFDRYCCGSDVTVETRRQLFSIVLVLVVTSRVAVAPLGGTPGEEVGP